MAAGQLLKVALARGDTVSAYLLAGRASPLALTYSRLGVSESDLQTVFGPILVAANPNHRSAKLLGQLQRQGSANTLRKAQVAVTYSLHHQRNG